MIYYLSEFPEIFYCPLCGNPIKELNKDEKYCEHFVGLFTEDTVDDDACHFLNEAIRKEYFPKLQFGYPGNMDDSFKLKYKSKKLKKLIKENNWFTLSFKGNNPGYYEDPIIRIILRTLPRIINN